MFVRNLLLRISVVSAFGLGGAAVQVFAVGELITPMQTVPPKIAEQVTMENYRDHGMSRWSFRNVGAPLHVVMVPREGEIHRLARAKDSKVNDHRFLDGQGKDVSFDALLEGNDADGVIVIKGDEVVHEQYFHDFDEHAQHIWFSMTKSLVSTAFGILVEQGKVDLQASPAAYIQELKGGGFERVTIQNVLDHATAISFKENYTDLQSDFFQYYAPALNLAWLPGAADAQPNDTKIYGAHDFLSQFIQADSSLKPGRKFDYNSSNADLLGWLIARISGQNLQDFIQENIWSKLGAEHDAYLAVDRAYMPVATGGMNSTLRDAARFGLMIRDRGQYRGQSIIPAAWVDKTLQVGPSLEKSFDANSKYAQEPWQAYHNMWWVLDAQAGEYCAVGVHGQVIYINRLTDTVMVWFSSQATASAASNDNFRVKLDAARVLAKTL